ncbi:cysteine sulfinate desulfinase [Pediococcus damnosus LMG 28219]|uniref:cysteine desulfurase n=1 Tax=Pediococcus damnosus TaxID=51663 RepID=UPI00061F187B|nr:cysteine desulfurase [Pediococcus damnosus]AMV60812.1 Cysteine desulfurase, SufS subfamily [Pediococcus damnosus]AMV65122.1 Cysteine desulfurase, SufS subfamily [Pediococcus damnosus]KJU74272.1 cysteine sulfinate desulfinase [Pediococcus damnosus LMG 28219]PIO81634.1 aminotransferase class V-fold PLP-dependent enzyme [Pediococcus damnosus]PIO84824.1 aminotransferase class V-fold PLP-dependent enzyme [Pediococcus damnosus]
MDKKFENVIKDFPILSQKINDEPLLYLDNAATSQTPNPVLNEMVSFYQSENANVHRGVYTLANEATTAYENVREQVAEFIHAPNAKSIVYTRSTTESLNLVASSFGDLVVHESDEILITIMEHHSNLIPWQQLAKRKHAKLKYVELADDQTLDIADFKRKLTERTKIVAVAQMSNVLGVTNPIKEITRLAHQQHAYVVVDAAQSVAHQSIDVQDLDVDFLAFSGHKMLGPTGIGVLFGKAELLDEMNPVQFGGEMIETVSRTQAKWQSAPWKFEAGTQNIGGVIGLGAAITYISKLKMTWIEATEHKLLTYLLPQLVQIKGLTIYGPQTVAEHGSIVAFNLANLHPHDVATGLDMLGVEVRAGHHCAQPLMTTLGVESTVRASLSFYNSLADMDRFVYDVKMVKEFFNRES